jgi:MoxR-like ATPase
MSNNETIFARGIQFHSDGIKALDNIAYGEQSMKDAVLTAMMAGHEPVLLAGTPGGAKSLAVMNIHRLISGIEQENIAVLPPDSSLQPIELVGGRIQTTKEFKGEDTNYSETVSSEVEGLIKPTTQVILADEATRINPYTFNSMLGAAAEKELKTKSGIVPLSRLILMATSLNPAESQQATFKMTNAMASRHIVGAIVGNNVTDEESLKMANDIFPDPELAKPIASVDELLQMRRDLGSVLLSPTVGMRLVQIAKSSNEVLGAAPLRMTEGPRRVKQLGRVARIQGLFEGRVPTDQDVDKALDMYVAARLGALSAQPDLAAAVDMTVDKILTHARNARG